MCTSMFQIIFFGAERCFFMTVHKDLFLIFIIIMTIYTIKFELLEN